MIMAEYTGGIKAMFNGEAATILEPGKGPLHDALAEAAKVARLTVGNQPAAMEPDAAWALEFSAATGLALVEIDLSGADMGAEGEVN